MSAATRVPDASEALQRLREGNRRFVAGRPAGRDPEARAALVGGQAPFAAILGCADSRVPPELIFDQGLGDLFVIRVVGNLVAPHQIGSVEFAVEALGVRLVVVLGHTDCGSVWATLAALRDGASLASAGLDSIVEGMRPSVEPLLERSRQELSHPLVNQAVRANVRNSVARLGSESALLARLRGEGEVTLLGAVYTLETGKVDFLEEEFPS